MRLTYIQGCGDGVITIGALHYFGDVVGEQRRNSLDMVLVVGELDYLVHDADPELVQRELRHVLNQLLNNIVKLLVLQNLDR
jgi:hypothetical protein